MRSPLAGSSHRPLGRLEIVQAIPAGSRRARTQAEFLAALSRDPELAELRPDAQDVVRGCARIWARYASWHDRTTRPTRERVCRMVRSSRRRASCDRCQAGDREHDHPLSVTAYKSARRWLEDHGYLGTVRDGWTPDLAAGALWSAEVPNEAAIYVLALPRRARAGHVRESLARTIRPLSGPRSGQRDPRAREAVRAGTPNPEKARASRGQFFVPLAAGRPALRPGQSSIDSGELHAVIRHRSRLLARLSERYWRSICRRFTEAGWMPGDILYALDHEPGGRQHWQTSPVANVAAWARFRLAFWLDSQGAPLPAPSQLRQAERDRVLAEQSARRVDRLRASQRRGNYAAGAAMARAQLARRQSPTERRSSSSVVPPI